MYSFVLSPDPSRRLIARAGSNCLRAGDAGAAIDVGLPPEP
jgi:hypothetical protein